MTRTKKYESLRNSMIVDIESCIELIVENYRKAFPNRNIEDLKNLCSVIIDEKDSKYGTQEKRN